MIKSMTGYGKAEATLDGIVLSVEMRTLNSRYRDIILRMPQELHPVDMAIRNAISERVSRGRIDVTIKMEPISDKMEYDVVLNEGLARAYMDVFNRLAQLFSIEPNITVDTFCNLRDVVSHKPKELNIEMMKEYIMDAINKALDSVDEMRLQEGEALKKDLLLRLKIVKERLEEIRKRAPILVEEYRDRLKENIGRLLEGTDISVDEARIVQEVAIFAERSDITEEIVRLESHIGQFYKFLQKDEPVGRRLDFLIQEMNREINTIGSKAPDALISNLVVEIKGEIEKLREQVQNIE